jgi:hypothetical protein
MTRMNLSEVLTCEAFRPLTRSHTGSFFVAFFKGTRRGTGNLVHIGQRLNSPIASN